MMMIWAWLWLWLRYNDDNDIVFCLHYFTMWCVDVFTSINVCEGEINCFTSDSRNIATFK